MLLVGTGSYVSAVVVVLRQREAGTIFVHSSSERATGFAERYAITPALDLDSAPDKTTLMATCHGSATLVATTANLEDATPTALLDLSLQPDVDPAMASPPGITLLDLAAIRAAISPTWAANSAHAEQIVAEGMHGISDRLTSHAADPAIASLRAAMLWIVNEEVARLPQGRMLTIEDCALALRHLITKPLRTPSVRARDAVARDRITGYLTTMEGPYDIGIQPDFNVKGHCHCLVTGLSFADLATEPTEIR